MPTPFELDLLRKPQAGGPRREVCADCGELRRFHGDGRCPRFRRMSDREWAAWCGTAAPPKEESAKWPRVIKVEGTGLANQYRLHLECGHAVFWMWEFANGAGYERTPDGRMIPRFPKVRPCNKCATEKK